MSIGSIGPADGADGVVVVPPLEADPLFVDAVDEAIAGPVAEPDQGALRASVCADDFPGLYVKHRSSLALHARRFLNDARDIDEVVQETFLRLFLALPEIENELQAIGFSRRVLTNLCIDRYRADRRRPRLVDLSESDATDVEDDPGYDDPILRAEDAAVVRQALALLSPLHRAALVKREIEEKPVPVIAAELNIPEESVKHVLFRARRALRRLLTGSAVDPEVDLSLGAALGVGVNRLGKATATGMKSFLILLVGLIVSLPLIHHGDALHPAGAIATSPGQPGADALPLAPHAALPAGAPGRAAGHHATAPLTPAPPAAGPSNGGTVPATPHRAAHDGWTTGTPTDPRTPRHPQPPPPPAPAPYSVSGAYTGAAAITGEAGGTDATGAATSVSALAARTSAGQLDVTQSVAVDANLQPQSASLSVAVPVPTGQIGFVVAVPSVVVTPQRDGSVVVVLSGTTDALGSVNDETASLTSVAATLHLDRQFRHVIGEHLVLTAAAATPAATPTGAPTVPDPSHIVTTGTPAADTLPLRGAYNPQIPSVTAITAFPGTTA